MRNTTMNCIQLILNSQTSFEVRSMFENSPEISAESKTWFLVENKLLATSTSSNTNAVLLKRTNDGKCDAMHLWGPGSWWFLNKVYKEAKQKRKQTTNPEGCRRCQGTQASQVAAPWPLQILQTWHTCHQTRQIQFFTPFKFARCLSRRARREYKFQQWGDKSLHDPRLEAHDRPWDKGIRSGKGLKTLPRPRHSSPAVFMLQIAHGACFPITKNDWNPCAQNDFPPGLFDLLSSWLYTDQDYLNCMVVHRKFYLPTDFHLCNRTSSANPRGPKQKIRPKQKMAAPQIWWTGFSDTWIKLKHSKTFANKNCCNISETARHRKSSRIFHTSWLDEMQIPAVFVPSAWKNMALYIKKPVPNSERKNMRPWVMAFQSSSCKSGRTSNIISFIPKRQNSLPSSKKDFHFWKWKASACVSATWCKFGCRSVSKLCATFTKGAPSCAAAGRRV